LIRFRPNPLQLVGAELKSRLGGATEGWIYLSYHPAVMESKKSPGRHAGPRTRSGVIQKSLGLLDSGFRRNEEKWELRAFYERIISEARKVK